MKKCSLAKRLLLRFVRGFVAGFCGTAISIGAFTGNQWRDLGIWLAFLSMSGLAGGITGGILAVDKYFRETKSSLK